MENTVAKSAQLAQAMPSLLIALERVESNVSELTLRLDLITQKVPTETTATEKAPMTITERLNSLGNTLQYLLDNIEL